VGYIELRTSERGAFKRCPQRWEWGVKMGLTPRRAANPLWWGQAMHVALAGWYLHGSKRGPRPAETFSEVLEGDRAIRVPSGDEALEAEYVDARDLGIAVLEHYVEHYGVDEHWDVIATEQTFEYWMPKLGLRKGRHIRYLGTFDGVYRDRRTGYIWLMEHKSAAGINTNHLPLDYQAGSYWLVAEFVLRKAGLIGPHEHIRGIMFNFVRKAYPDVRPQDETGAYTNKPTKDHYKAALKAAGAPWETYGTMSMSELQLLARKLKLHVLGEVSKIQPAPYFLREPVSRSVAERRTQRLRIQQDAWHIERARNDPDYPIIKNPTKDCSWDCAFYKMCQLDEQGDQESVQDFMQTLFVVRDPYEDHRDDRKSA
jgi:hypothetical protein